MTQRRATYAAGTFDLKPTPTRAELVALARKCLLHMLDRGTQREDKYQLAAIKLTIETYDIEADVMAPTGEKPLPIRSIAEIAELTEILRQKRKAG